MNPKFCATARLKDRYDGTKQGDLGRTQDGYTIVSERFRAFCERHRFAGLQFVPLPASPGMFWWRIQRMIEVDNEGSRTRFNGLCSTCHAYSEVLFGAPLSLRFKNVAEPLPDEFFRTDTEFGTAHNQSPMLITGAATRALLLRERFRGLELAELEVSFV